MSVRTPPIFLQSEAHTAELVRQQTANLLGAGTAAFSVPIGGADQYGHGVVQKGHLSVTQNGTPNMSVNVSAGGAFIRGSSAAAQGVYSFYNDGTVNLSIDAADATNARRDLIVAQVRDSAYAGSDNDARLFVVKGTAAGSPVDPTPPANSLVLARVTVGAGVSTITNANIAGLQLLARPYHSAWGVLAIGEDSAERTNRTVSAAINAAVSITFATPGDRRYRISGWCLAEQNTSTGLQALRVYKGGAALRLVSRIDGCTAGSITQHSGEAYDTPSAGSVTYDLRLSTSAGTVDARGDIVPTRIVIEDVGPA